MRRRVPVRSLRGADPVGVEIEVNGLAAKPLGQIAPENVADLFAISAKEDLPPGLRVRLRGVDERLTRQVEDLPNGTPFLDWIAGLSELSPQRVPYTLRAVVAAEIEAPKRGAPECAAAVALMEAWAAVEPEPFSFAAPKMIPKKMTAAAAPREAQRPRERRAVEARPERVRVVVEVDKARVGWIRATALERLQPASERGLLEAVLMAGLQHRARELYPDLQVHEIRKVLETMAERGDVKHSAGRWTRPLRGR